MHLRYNFYQKYWQLCFFNHLYELPPVYLWSDLWSMRLEPKYHLDGQNKLQGQEKAKLSECFNASPCYNWPLYFNQNQYSSCSSSPMLKASLPAFLLAFLKSQHPSILPIRHTHAHISLTDTTTQPILAGNPRAAFKRLVKPCLSVVLRAWQKSTSLGLCGSVAYTQIHTHLQTLTPGLPAAII